MRAALAIVLMLSLLVSPALAQDGTITGVITTSYSQAVPDALVLLSDMDGNYVDVPDNPQFSSNGTGNNVGVYTFYDVPPGTYNVTAEKGESLYFAIATVDGGTSSTNIVLPDYYVTPEDFPVEAPGGREPTKPFITFVPATFGKPPQSVQATGGPSRMGLASSTVFALLLQGSR